MILHILLNLHNRRVLGEFGLHVNSIVCAIVSMVQGLTQKEWVAMGKVIKPASATLIEFDLGNEWDTEIVPKAMVRNISMLPDNWTKSYDNLSICMGKDNYDLSGLMKIIDETRLNTGARNLNALVTPFNLTKVEQVIYQTTEDFNASPWGERHRSPRVIHVVSLPKLLGPEHQVQNSLVVLIDVLRLTSTVITAMGEGLNSARMYSSVAEVKHAALRFDGKHSILGGEQKRCLIPGFNRDNSPMSYLKGVTNKAALMLTTNGTRALPWVRKAKILVLGSFLNVSALVKTIMHLADRVDSVLLVCAGCNRGKQRAQDDELCAAYILRTLISQTAEPSKLVLDSTATQLLQQIQHRSWEEIKEMFMSTPAADELRNVSMGSDLGFCLQRDKYGDILPIYHPKCDLFLTHRVRYEILTRTLHGDDARLSKYSAFLSPRRDDKNVINLFLVSSVNPEQQLTGRIDPILGEEEEKLAQAVAELVRKISPSMLNAVVCSPLRRARVTAELIACQHNLAPVIYNGLTAVDYGDWTGLRVGEVKQHFPGQWESWNSLGSWAEHGGESYDLLVERVMDTFHSIVRSMQRRYGSVCIVSHQSAIRSIVANIRGYSQTQWVDLTIGQASLTFIQVTQTNDENSEDLSMGTPLACEVYGTPSASIAAAASRHIHRNNSGGLLGQEEKTACASPTSLGTPAASTLGTPAADGRKRTKEETGRNRFKVMFAGLTDETELDAFIAQYCATEGDDKGESVNKNENII